MAFSNLVEHYRQLLDTAQWLDICMSWTAIQPLNKPVSIEDIAERVAGADAEIRMLDVREGPLSEPAVHIADCGSSIMLLDTLGAISPWAPETLNRLSEKARFWNVGWHANGGERLVHAVDGRVLVQVTYLDRTTVYGADPHALDHVLHLLPEPVTRLSKASAMAIIELESGARLDLEWIEAEQTAVIVGSGDELAR